MRLFVGFGTGRQYRYYRINSICPDLEEEQARALPMFIPSQVLMQHHSSAVNAKSLHRKHGKHIRQPLLGSPARLRVDLILWNLHLQHLD
jgi:hypothetical protein